MSTRLAFDTNAYAEIARDTGAGRRLTALLSTERGRVVVLLPVVSELLQRTQDARYQKRVVATVHDAVVPNRRVSPDGADWSEVGRAVAAMAAAGHDPVELKRRSFYLDVHLAVMCRARGIALVTSDADHARVRAHVGHAVEPFPA